MNGKGLERDGRGLFEVLSVHFLKGLRENTKIFGSQSPGRDSKRSPPEYDSRALPLFQIVPVRSPLKAGGFLPHSTVSRARIQNSPQLALCVPEIQHRSADVYTYVCLWNERLPIRFAMNSLGDVLVCRLAGLKWSRRECTCDTIVTYTHRVPHRQMRTKYFNRISDGPSQWPRGLRHEPSSLRSNTGIVSSNPTQGINVCVRLFCICFVLCVGSGLAMGWSPVQGVLPAVYRLRNW
jgi:hypothetical protein